MCKLYDSEADTRAHIMKVQEYLSDAIRELAERSVTHDQTKLVEPEKAIFDKVTPRLKNLTYGSDEYKKALADMKPALDHHYSANRHHPEHGIMDEQWKVLTGIDENHEVSSYGRIRRKAYTPVRSNGRPLSDKETFLKVHVTPEGYAQLQIRGINYFVHTLVARCFLPERPDDTYQINHRDGDKLNNHYGNLEWVTSGEDLKHAYDNFRKAKVKYVVHCVELDITTMGVQKMEAELRAMGHDNAEACSIWNCIAENGHSNRHCGLTFIGYNLAGYAQAVNLDPVSKMDLFDVMELICDWAAATHRHADGNINTSIKYNTDRFHLSPQVAKLLQNTVDRMSWGAR